MREERTLAQRVQMAAGVRRDLRHRRAGARVESGRLPGPRPGSRRQPGDGHARRLRYGPACRRADLHPRVCSTAKPMSMILFAAVGVLGGLLRDVAPDKEAIWKFSPFPGSEPVASAAPPRPAPPAFSLVCVLVILFVGAAARNAALKFSKRVRAAEDLGRSRSAGCSSRSTRPRCFPPRCPSKSGTAIAQRKEAGAAAVALERSAPGRAQPADQSAFSV